MSANEFNIPVDELADNPLLQVVSELDRIIIKLHFYGLTVLDIAMVVNAPEAAISERIERIKAKLKDFQKFLV